ncbi:MAG TPA: terminase family protein [Rariglobus sp.]
MRYSELIRTMERKEPRAPREERPPAVSAWVERELGFTPDATQARLLDTGSKFVLLNCSRQWGKSTTTAARAVHEACTVAESLTLVVSPSARQSGEFLRKAEALTRKRGMRLGGDGDNEISLAFPNGSRVVGLPGNEQTVRGFSAVSLLLMDEAARVSEELYLAVRPMLAVSGGAIWLLSTPNGKRGFFWEAWEHGGREWERVRVAATECPRIPGEFLERERRTMADRYFRQEYLCEFVQGDDAVFDRELIERAFSDEFEPLRLEKAPWEK